MTRAGLEGYNTAGYTRIMGEFCRIYTLRNGVCQELYPSWPALLVAHAREGCCCDAEQHRRTNGAHLARDMRTSRPSSRRTTSVSPETTSTTRPGTAAPAAAPAASASGTVKPNKVPMLVPRCRSKANFVGVNFEFQENDPDFCSSAAASLWDLEEEDEEESEDEKTDGAEGPEGQQEEKPKQMKNLAYGLISRLYFYY